MQHLKPDLCSLFRDEQAQDLIEYTLVAAMIGLASAAAMSGLANSIGNTLSAIGGKLTSAT
jgi:Flp pilus assembly pilin Flp